MMRQRNIVALTLCVTLLVNFVALWKDRHHITLKYLALFLIRGIVLQFHSNATPDLHFSVRDHRLAVKDCFRVQT